MFRNEEELEMENRKYKIGYTTGVFDLFHVGHLNILRRSKQMCEHLIAGVSTDELVFKYKHRKPVIPYSERVEILEAIRYVDKVVPQISRDKMAAYEKYKFDVMFVGDDWKGSELFAMVESELKKKGSTVIYFPYTQNTSSSLLKETLDRLNGSQDE